MNWNEKVKYLMNKRGINQKQLSALSGITESSISRYLSGNKNPRMDIIVNVARALNVSADYFLEDEEKCESAYAAISTAIARKGNELTSEEKNKLILLLLGEGGSE